MGAPQLNFAVSVSYGVVTSVFFLMVVEEPSIPVADVESSTLCDEPSGVSTLCTLRFDWVTPPAAFRRVDDADEEAAEPVTSETFFLTLVEDPSASDLVSTSVDALPRRVSVFTDVDVASSANAGTITKERIPSEIDSVLKDRNMISSIAAVCLS